MRKEKVGEEKGRKGRKGVKEKAKRNMKRGMNTLDNTFLLNYST